MLTGTKSSFHASDDGNHKAPANHDLHDITYTAIRTSRTHLRAREQDVTLDLGPLRPTIELDKLALTRLLASAIREVSGLALRHQTVAISLAERSITIRGKNPLDLPEGDLAIDHKLALQARRLGIATRLHWDQGTGPVLILDMPGDTPNQMTAVSWNLAPWPLGSWPSNPSLPSIQVHFQKNA
jgi:hypothetical protein